MSDTQVVYRGTSDFQEFGKKDFAKVNIDQGKLRFERNVPKEVSAEVAEVLTRKEGLFGPYDFELATEDDVQEAVNSGNLPASALSSLDEDDSDDRNYDAISDLDSEPNTY